MHKIFHYYFFLIIIIIIGIAVNLKLHGQVGDSTLFINDKTYTIVEEMPRFPGCEDELEISKRKQCANSKLITFLFRHLKIPPIPKEEEMATTAVVSFVVEKDGSLSNITVIRDIDGILGNELFRIINLMNVESIKWKAGKQNGKPVRVEVRLPLKIQLE